MYERESILQQLLAYLKLGWPLFPVHGIANGRCTCDRKRCDDPGKHPMTKNGHKDAVLEPRIISSLLVEYQALGKPCNWGIATGEASGLLVVDADDLHKFAALEEQYGTLPTTPTVQSGRDGGGKHYYFRYPSGSRISIGNGKQYDLPFDWRANGGYVIVPPSLHLSGRRYSWLVPPETPLAPAPERLIQLIAQKKKPGSKPSSSKTVSVSLPLDKCGNPTLTVVSGPADLLNSPGIGEGSRNATLCKLVGVHVARGEAEDHVEALALLWNSKCSPPASESKVRDTVRRLWQKHHGTIHDPVDNFASPPQAANRKPSSDGNGGTVSGQRTAGSSTVVDTVTTPVSVLRVADDDDENEDHDALEDDTVSGQRFAEGDKNDDDSGRNGAGVVAVDARPTLHSDALYGLVGAIVQAIEPETEADPAGILLSLLAGTGNAIGRAPHFRVGSTRHGTNLFVLLIAGTGTGKGPAWGEAQSLLGRADSSWLSKCVIYGFGSGEGLVERVADPDDESDGTPLPVSQVPPDKRLLAVDEEFAGTLALKKRENSTLGSLICKAWDGETMEVLNRKKNSIRAAEAHIGIVGMITQEELRHCCKNTVIVENGFLNRFLMCAVGSEKDLPHGGDTAVLANISDTFGPALAKAIDQAKGVDELKRSAEADRLWEQHYARLKRPPNAAGLVAKMLAKARPQVMRLAMIYALLDNTNIIGVAHLKAALAVWNYCATSARLVFTEGVNSTNTTPPAEEPLSKQLLSLIEQTPGITKSELHEATGKRYTAEARRTALAWLKENGLAHPEQCPLPQGGPAAECWYPGPQSVEDDDEDEGPSANRQPPTVTRASVSYPTPTLIVEVQADDDPSADRKPPAADGESGSASSTDGGLRTADSGAEKNDEAESATDGGLRTAAEDTMPTPIIVSVTDSGLRTADGEAEKNGQEESATACGQRTADDGQAPSLTLTQLVDEVRAAGGRFVWRGGVVAVDADDDKITPAMIFAWEQHQAALAAGIPRQGQEPPTTTATKYASAADVEKVVKARGGKIEKDDEGRCTLTLPQPDPELEAEFVRYYDAICSQLLSEKDFFGRLDALRPR